jgi:hypothetical protein
LAITADHYRTGTDSARMDGGSVVDMLVRLYDLPDTTTLRREIARSGTSVRRAMAHEKETVVDWVQRTFGRSAYGWKSECDVAFSRLPITCHVAVHDGTVVGFACHDTTGKNFFGPIGVEEGRRGQGIGKLLLITGLEDMYAQGYAYAIIGQVGAPGFFQKNLGAQEIPGSSPGIYPKALVRQ